MPRKIRELVADLEEAVIGSLHIAIRGVKSSSVDKQVPTPIAIRKKLVQTAIREVQK